MVTHARNQQRGAAVFIVVMVLTLLTAIGIFAIRSASLVTVASGHLRQEAQTAHFGEYALRAAISEVGAPDLTTYYVMERTSRNRAQDSCLVNRGLEAAGISSPCTKLGPGEIEQSIQKNFAGETLIVPQTPTTDGSLGPRLGTVADPTATLEGVFSEELHDVFRAPGTLVGLDVAKQQFVPMNLTITGYAQIRTAAPGAAGQCPAASMGPTASLQAVRAFLTVMVQQ